MRSRPFCGSRSAVCCSLVVAAPPPFRVTRSASLLLCVASLFFSFSFAFCAPVVSGFLWFPAPGALGLGAVCCLFCWPPDSRLSVRSRLFVFPARPLAAPWWLLPPPPRLLCPAVFVAAVRCSVFFCFFLLVGCSRRLPPFLPGACVVPCAVWCCRAALPLRVACCAVVPRLVVLWAAAAVRCLLGCLFVCCAELLVAAVCCALSLVVPSGWVVRGVACCLVLVCVAVCHAVLCAPGCGAAPCCCVWRLPVLCCVVLCCFVALVLCRCLLCRVP